VVALFERPSVGPTGVGRARVAPLDFAGRLAAVRESMPSAGCDAVLVTGLANVRYLTGFSGSAGMVFVGPASAVLVTDGRYKTSAAAEVGPSGVRVEAAPAAKQAELLADLLAGLPPGARRLGLEAEHVSWATQRRWSEGWAKEAELVPTTGLVELLRRRKEPAELARLAAAAAIADEALARALPLVGGGPTEVELATALEAEMRRLGAEAPAFPTIVASGPGGAEPHHHPSDRRLRAGDLVTVDFGARWEGYCSDSTRTFWVGGRGGQEELARVLAVVRASQEAGLQAVRAGVAASAVDRACREVVEAAGLGELFVHGTGHGVGLDVHEAPSLSATSEDVLEVGHVVTVEPGVYIGGVGGARIEDTVVVTEDGCEALTQAPTPKGLMIAPGGL
jgi:Xaa-Pro aminopeptidase